MGSTPQQHFQIKGFVFSENATEKNQKGLCPQEMEKQERGRKARGLRTGKLERALNNQDREDHHGGS